MLIFYFFWKGTFMFKGLNCLILSLFVINVYSCYGMMSDSDLISIANRYKLNPICIAIDEDQSESIDSLIRSGCDVNQKNVHDGNTPLHIAVKLNCLYIVQKLVEQHHALVHLRNKQGKTACAIARELGFTDISQYLKEKEDKLYNDIFWELRRI